MSIMQRVKSGNRKRYERMRAAENWGRLGGIVQERRQVDSVWGVLRQGVLGKGDIKWHSIL